MVEGKKVWISTNPTGGASAWTSTTLPATTGTVTALTGIACPSTTLCVATGHNRCTVHLYEPDGRGERLDQDDSRRPSGA